MLFPSQLKSYLAPGIRIYSIAFPGISLVDDDNNGNGMESKFFKIGPLEPEVGKNKIEFQPKSRCPRRR